MKKWFFTLTLIGILSLSQAAFAADWRPVEGVANIFWNAEDLQYLKDDSGTKVDGDLVIVSIKRPVSPEGAKQMSEAQTDPEAKAGLALATTEVRNYCYGLTNRTISYAGAFWLDKDNKIIGELQVISEFVQLPEDGQPGPVSVLKVYHYLQAEAQAGRIK